MGDGRLLSSAFIREIWKFRGGVAWAAVVGPTYDGGSVSELLPKNVKVIRPALYDVIRKLNMGESPAKCTGMRGARRGGQRQPG